MKIPYDSELLPIARKLRNNLTYYERKIWNYLLRDKQLCGYKFTRQKPILNYIVDFYSAKLLLVIEIEGEIHDYKLTYDNSRTERIKQLKIKIITIKNSEIEEDLEKTRDKLVKEIRNRENEILSNPLESPLVGGELGKK
ncbi:MAG: DUF559 domain-containing protein [Candidatus Cloacimonetes bacterium]|nr:DUF559 domain-containing protein [Candidatus Cloacimonadota bacterium]MCF7813813.1 DUF559 domain-containing protein [Candidatus Cloacimonadota bacterium]MCF7868492.1 DUF559 domain-containing protein [Candidatus Cloacimonadota bacterium]